MLGRLRAFDTTPTGFPAALASPPAICCSGFIATSKGVSGEKPAPGNYSGPELSVTGYHSGYCKPLANMLKFQSSPGGCPPRTSDPGLLHALIRYRSDPVSSCHD